MVEVRDHDPGVPDHAVVQGRSDRGSSGLSVDIARNCAEASGGRLVLNREGPRAGGVPGTRRRPAATEGIGGRLGVLRSTSRRP